MYKEKRKSQKPIPDNLEEYINRAQLKTLREIRRFGWLLFAVRRPLFMERAVIIKHVETNKFAVVKVDGTVDYHYDILIRNACDNESTPLLELAKIS